MGMMDRFTISKKKQEKFEPQQVQPTIKIPEPPQLPTPVEPQVQEQPQQTGLEKIPTEDLLLTLKMRARRLHFIEEYIIGPKPRKPSEFRQDGKTRMEEYDYLNECDELKYILGPIVQELINRGNELEVNEVFDIVKKQKNGYEFEFK